MIDQITVCANHIGKRASSIHAAANFASRHKANLTAYFIKLDSSEILRWSGAAPFALIDQILVDQDEREREAREKFDQLCEDYRCQHQFEVVYQSAEPISQMICTDFIFVEQADEDGLMYPGDDAFIHNMLMRGKRPIIVTPPNWQQTIGTRVLLGWDSSPQAMRAVADSLPVLKSAEEVTVLNIVKDRLFTEENNSTGQIDSYLRNKDINTRVVIEHAPGFNDEVPTLIEAAEKNESNLIVIGGFGHSRLREWVLGGMTKHLLEHSPLPVLMSH